VAIPKPLTRTIRRRGSAERSRQPLIIITLAMLAVTALAGSTQRSTSRVTRHPVFRDVAVERGLDFTHTNGASAEKFFPEIMGSGGMFLDVDNDGWLDVFLVDGGSLASPAVAGRARPIMISAEDRAYGEFDRDGRSRRGQLLPAGTPDHGGRPR